MGYIRRGLVIITATAVGLGMLPAVASAGSPSGSVVVASAKILKSAKPAVKGAPAIGSTIKAKPKKTKWTAATTFTYQWFANGKKIKKATKPTLKVTKKLSGKRLSVKVTGKKSGFAPVTVTSKKTAKATYRTLTKTITPFAKDGRLRVPIEGDSGQDPENCRQSSFAKVANVYECGFGMTAVAACWPSPFGPYPAGDYAYCLSPDDTSYVMTQYLGFQTQGVGKPVAKPWPLQLVLERGLRCYARIGGSPPGPFPAGYSWSYDCADGSYLLTPTGKNVTDQKGTRWSVKLTTFLTETETSPLKTAYVRTAIFAGAVPKAPNAKSSKTCTAGIPKKVDGGQNVLGGAQCVGSWALASYFYHLGGFGPKIVYHKVKGKWTAYGPSKNGTMCTKTPNPVPAALFDTACFGDQ